MDVAALQLSVKSDDVVAATRDLDKFATSADKAAASTGKLSGTSGTTKMAQDYARAAQAADRAGGSISRIVEAAQRANAAMNAAASASSAMRVANDNTTRSFAMADSQVNAYRNHLQQLVPSQNAQMKSAAGMAAANNTSAGSVAAVGVAGRATGAIMSGVAGIFGGVLGTAIGFVVSGLIEMASEFFETSQQAENLTKGLDTTSFATHALGDAQSILSSVFDMTTGRIVNQTGALHDLARAQLLVAQAQSMGRLAEHRNYLSEVSRETGRTDKKWYQAGSARDPVTGGYSSGWYAPTFEARIAQGTLGGTLSAQDAMRTLAGMQASGGIKPETFSRMLGAVTGIGAEAENQKIYEKALKSVDSGKLNDTFANASRDQSRATRAAPRQSSRSAAMTEEARALQERTRATAQFIDTLADETAQIGMSEAAQRQYQIVQALARATTDEQREAIAKLSVEREKSLKIERQAEEVAAAQKTLESASASMVSGIDVELQTMHLVGAERDKEIARIQRQIEMTDLLAKIKIAEADGNKKLVDTYTALGEKIDENYSKQIQLIDGRAAFDKMNELNSVMTRGVDSLNSGLVDAIMGAQSFGSVFKNVANQIVADLIRIALKQLIVNSLMKAIGGGGAGGIGGFLGGLFADGAAFDQAQRFADGGTFTNQIVTQPTLFRFAKGTQIGEMGEAGPEAIMPLSRLPNGKLGVHAMGGGAGRGPISVTNEITNSYTVSGGFMPETVIALIRQGGEATEAQIRRNLQEMLAQLDRDGTLV